MKELILKKCLNCGALVEVYEDCTCSNCGIKCCGEEMKKLEPHCSNNEEESVLTYEVIGDVLVVKVNPNIANEHNVEWVSMVSDEVVGKKFISDKINAATFPYIPGSTLYAYCNEHGLWCTKID